MLFYLNSTIAQQVPYNVHVHVASSITAPKAGFKVTAGGSSPLDSLGEVGGDCMAGMDWSGEVDWSGGD